MEHHLAQVNVGRLVAPVDDPQVAEFMAALDPINALADASPGFVWRLQTEDGDATAVRVFDDDSILINQSVWTDLDALHAFVYRTDHRRYLARRREWFETMTDVMVALWWVPAGVLPTPLDAVARLDHLRTHGPTPQAFTFRERFAPSSPGSHALQG